MHDQHYTGQNIRLAVDYLGAPRKIVATWLDMSEENFCAHQYGGLPLPPDNAVMLDALVTALAELIQTVRRERKPEDERMIFSTVAQSAEFFGLKTSSLLAEIVHHLVLQATKWGFHYVEILNDPWLDEYHPVYVISGRTLREGFTPPPWLESVRETVTEVIHDQAFSSLLQEAKP